MKRNLLASSLLLASLFSMGNAHASLENQSPYSVEVNQQGFLIDGNYKILRGGTVQWFRIPQESWRDRLERFKAAGFNTVDMYVAWNQIEINDNDFNFDAPNIRHFLELCQEIGLYVYFRPGPYITNELDGGGVPGWLMDISTKRNTKADGKPNLRTDDPDFLFYVERYFGRLNEVIKPYLASNGGPIILYALENEYNWFQIFHEADKLSIYNGKFERSWLSTLPTKGYFTALRDMTLEDGIDVPLTSCPGDGKTTGMGDVAGLIPMPNVYNGLGGEMPEKVAYDLLQDMHNPNNHDGNYVNFPSGTTETDRDPARIKRMIMGGFDAAFPFNIAGMHQEGYMNSMVLNANGSDVISRLLDFNLDRLITGFIAPTVAYFHNVIDYNGAISPSGIHRNNFYDFRRDNLFFDTVEPYLAASTHANRSGLMPAADSRLTIDSDALGAIEGENRIHYWHEGPTGTRFISLVNQSGEAVLLAPESIQLDGLRFPRYSIMEVPVKSDPGVGQFTDPDTSNAMVLTTHLPIPEFGTLNYSTSEILTLRDYNGDTLLIVHGSEGSIGELSLSEPLSELQVEYSGDSMVVQQQSEQGITCTYDHHAQQHLVLSNSSGQRLRIIATSTDQAGRFWFEKQFGQDIVISGADYIKAEADNSFNLEFDAEARSYMVMAPFTFSVPAGFSPLADRNEVTQAAVFSNNMSIQAPTLNTQLLLSGKITNDIAEAAADFDDSSWNQWQGEPAALESKDIIKGHAWYRAEVELSESDLATAELYIEHASDLVGIYVNGQYVTTVAPVGTEIDSASKNKNYRFNGFQQHLKAGINVIAFRTEIWGHGSFMFPRGKILGSKGQLPAVGFDSIKGLFGKATLAKMPLAQWSVKAELNGETKGYAATTYNDSGWESATLPMTLNKGDVRWYRTTFDAADLPDINSIHAPVVLSLKGKNTKATIFVNGRLIGRWLSDTEWLSRGAWSRAQRDMWMNSSPDDFPMNRGILNPPGTENVVSIVYEDTSGHNEAAGNISNLSISYAKENQGETAFRGRAKLTLN